MILTQCDLLIGIESLDTVFLSKEAIKPDFSIRMGVHQSLQKGRWAVTMEVTGTDKGGNRIKRVGVDDDCEQRNNSETWPGRRMPLTHKSTKLEVRFGKGTPQSS